MSQIRSKEIFNELPDDIKEIVTILAVSPSLTQNVAVELLRRSGHANGNASEKINELKSFPVWVQRNRVNWAIDDELREVALKKLNGSGKRLKKETLNIFKDFQSHFSEFSHTEAKDLQLQIARLALSVPEEREHAIESLRSIFEAAELFNNHESSRVISTYIDESLRFGNLNEHYSEHTLSAFFIRGLYAYRSKDNRTALKYLIPVWKQRRNSFASIRDAGIASHLIGLIYSKDRNRFEEAEKAYLQSIEIGEEINHTHHLAQVYHSLGNLYSKYRNRFEEAENNYLKSIELRFPLNDTYGLAQVYHSLGNLYSKYRNRFEEAEKAYLQSIEIGEEINHTHHLAQVYHSLGNLYSKYRNRFEEAENNYLKSIELLKQINDTYGLAQVYHSLGNLYSKYRNRFEEAEKAYLQSLELEKINNNNYGLAQVLANYGKLKTNQSEYKKAKELFEESLKYQTVPKFINLVEKLIRDLPL